MATLLDAIELYRTDKKAAEELIRPLLLLHSLDKDHQLPERYRLLFDYTGLFFVHHGGGLLISRSGEFMLMPKSRLGTNRYRDNDSQLLSPTRTVLGGQPSSDLVTIMVGKTDPYFARTGEGLVPVEDSVYIYAESGKNRPVCYGPINGSLPLEGLGGCRVSIFKLRYHPSGDLFNGRLEITVPPQLLYNFS